jgi:nucleoside-diphosphate-sugar epimerase
MNKRVLVTGGTGFIGSRILRKLKEANYVPVMLKRSNSDTWRIKDLLHDITYYDIDKIPVEKIFELEHFDSVMNLATYYKKHNSLEDIERMFQTNVEFPAKLLELCVQFNVPLFITAGSYFQYEQSSSTINESTILVGRNLYAATKNALQSIMDYYSSVHRIRTIDMILFTPYGEMDHEEKLIPYLINRILDKKRAELSYGFQRLNLLYVEDVANAFVKAIEISDPHVPLNFKMNVGDKRSYSIREILTIMEEILGVHIEVKWGSILVDQIDRTEELKIDTSKAEEYLDWSPAVSIQEGLRRTFNYYKAQGENS